MNRSHQKNTRLTYFAGPILSRSCHKLDEWNPPWRSMIAAVCSLHQFSWVLQHSLDVRLYFARAQKDLPSPRQVGSAKDEGRGSASSTADGERRNTGGGEERCQQNEHQRIEGWERWNRTCWEYAGHALKYCECVIVSGNLVVEGCEWWNLLLLEELGKMSRCLKDVLLLEISDLKQWDGQPLDVALPNILEFMRNILSKIMHVISFMSRNSVSNIPCHSDVVPAPSDHGTSRDHGHRKLPRVWAWNTRVSRRCAARCGKMWENVNAEAIGFATLVVLVSFRILFGLFSHLVHSFSFQIPVQFLAGINQPLSK